MPCHSARRNQLKQNLATMLCLKAMLLQIDLSVTITLVPLGVFLFLQLKDFREWSLLDIRGGLVLSIEVLSWH